jgi:3-oxoacyl-[acyl-carrier protein] reductase
VRLEGRVALVTGAGSGIGRAIARRFAQEGARVVVNDIDPETAESAAAEIGRDTRPVVADVADSAQVRAMFAEVERTLGGLDVLVNNAGVGEVDGEDDERRATLRARMETRVGEMLTGTIGTHWDVTQSLSDEAWARMLAVHLNGTFYCTRAALALMSRVNRGAIVNVSSVAGLMGIEVAPHYGAAKAGILGFTRSVAREVASRGIRVNAICPGWIDTPILDPLPPMVRLLAQRQTPLGRLGTADEVATVALFLASDEASFVTGQWLSPNGGLLTV